MANPITPAELRTLLDRGEQLTLLDVRRRADRDLDPVTIPGATWRDPESIDAWCGEIDVGRAVVAFCVHGHAVSRSVVDALDARGVVAHRLEDGLEGWKAAGGRTESSPGSP